MLAALVPLSKLGNFSAPNAILAMAYVVSWLFGTVVVASWYAGRRHRKV